MWRGPLITEGWCGWKKGELCRVVGCQELTHFSLPLLQPLLTWLTASTRRSTRARPSRDTRSLLWRRLLSRPSTWRVQSERGWPILWA